MARRWVGCLLLLLLAACGPPPFVPMCLGVWADPSNPQFGVAGRPVTLVYRLAEPCAPPGSLQANALDPSSREVEVVSTLEGDRGTVTFTPPIAGRFTLALRFDARHGAQANIEVAADRSREPGLDVPVGDLGYFGVHLDEAGRVIDPFAHLVFTRAPDGGRNIVQELPNSPDVVLAGAALWVRDSPRMYRFERGTLSDGGDGYVPMPKEPFMFEAGIILPSERDVVLVGETVRFARVLSDGGLESHDVWPHGGSASVRGRVGDELITDAPGGYGAGDCALSLTDGGGEICRMASPALVYRGGDLDGYWVTDLVVPSLTFRGPHFSQSSPLAVRYGVDWVGAQDGRGPPRFSFGGGEVFVARQDHGRIGLELWGAEVLAVTETAVVTRGDAGTAVHRR